MGVNVLSTGYIASLDTIQKNPDLVRRFVRATQKGWADAEKDPAAGVRSILKVLPNANEKVNTAGMPMAIEHLRTKSSEGKPLLWTAEQDWKDTLAIMKDYGGLEGNKSSSDFYTNEFVP